MAKKKKHLGIKLEATDTSSVQRADLPSVCRVCLGSDADNKHMQLTDLFGAYRDSTVYEHINSVTDIQIHKEDSLPDKICATCLLDLGTVIDFRERCVQSHTALQNTTDENYKYKSEIDIKEEKQELKVDSLLEDFEKSSDLFENDTPNNNNDSELEKRYQSASNTEVICNECNEAHKSKSKLRIHWKKEHLLETLTCPICKRIFKSHKAFITHKKTKPRNCLGTQQALIEGVGKNRIFGCPKCSYSTNRQYHFSCHYRRHIGIKDYHCKICPNKSFGQTNLLQRHMEVTHGECKVEITCEFCGKHVRGRDRVYKHLTQHSNKRYQCDVCKKLYKTKNLLIRHLQYHSNVKSYKCDQCPLSYYTSSTLCQHKRVHADIRNWYQCDICSWKSAQKYRVKRHRAKHNVNNVCCNFCGIFFQDDFRLQRHMKLHGKKVPCAVCGREYLSQWNLKCHMMKKHSISSSSLQVQTNKLVASSS